VSRERRKRGPEVHEDRIGPGTSTIRPVKLGIAILKVLFSASCIAVDKQQKNIYAVTMGVPMVLRIPIKEDGSAGEPKPLQPSGHSLLDAVQLDPKGAYPVDHRRAAQPGIASFIKLCAAPKEPFRNHCRIKLIPSGKFPDNDRPRVVFPKGRFPLALFPKHGAHVRLENNQ
jgi:hypothetical protein